MNWVLIYWIYTAFGTVPVYMGEYETKVQCESMSVSVDSSDTRKKYSPIPHVCVEKPK